MKKINFQLSELNVELLEKSQKIIKIKIAPGSGISEQIRVGDDGVTLDCIMTWNTGSFNYEIPANNLIKLLKSKPFDKLNSEDLNEFDFELIKVQDGDLDYKKVNDIDIENEKEIIESLKGSKYEIDVEGEEDKYHEIEEQMRALYDDGDIYDSEYSFGSLFSLEFEDDELGSYFIDWHYSKNLYDNAKKYHNDSNYEKAIELLKKYITYEDKSEGIINGLRLIAESYEQLEDYVNAIHFYEKVIKLDSSNDYYFAHKGYCLKKEKKYSEAEEAFKAAINLNPQNIYAITFLADCYEEINNYEEALSVLNKGIEDNPTQPPNTTSRFWLFRQKAEILFDQDNNFDAIDFYKLAIEIEENAWCYNKLGMCYQNIENFDEALLNFEKAIEKDERLNDAYVNYNMGECHRRSGRYSESLEFYKSSINHNNENVLSHAYDSMGISYLNLREFEKSIESLKKANPTKWTFQNLGKAFFGLEDYESALKEFDNVIEKDAGYKWGYQERGKTHEKLGNDQLAIKDFDKVIEIDANYKWAYHEKGKVFLKLNEYALALESFENVIEMDSEYKSVFYDIALSYHFMGKYEKAINYYNKVSDWTQRQNLLLYYNIVSAENKTSPSLKNEEELLEDKSDKFLVQALLGRGKREHYYSGSGDFNIELSLNDLSRVIEIDPESFQAYFIRSKFYLNYKSSEYYSVENGIDDLKNCLKIKRYPPALIKYAGLISDFNEKTKLIVEAVELNPENAFAWQKYGETLYENKDYEGALEKFKKSDELDSDGFSLQRIAKTYAALKLNTEAIDFYNKAINLVDWYENWMFELSEVYVETKQFDEAESSILKALNYYPLEKYYRQLYNILSLQHPSEDYKTVLKEVSDFIDSCNLGHDSDSEKLSDIEYFKTYEKKLSIDDKSIFSFFKFLKGETVNHLIENGGYITKIHLLKNNSLNISLDHIKKIISTSDYTVLESAISHQLVTTEMLDEIINSNDNSYLYSYQLLGVCSNPNVTEQQIEKLKSNKYNWVKQKAYSVTKEFNEIDTSDRYVLLGLINNPDFNSSENDYKKLLESTSPYNFTYKLDAGRVGIEEYNVAYIPEEDVIEGFLEVAPQDENWSDYIANEWYNYGESEYGVTDYVDEIKVWSDEESSTAIPSCVSQVQSWPKNEDTVNPSTGEFVQIVTSGEKGEWEYHEFEMENEFRPENLYPKYTDSERAIEGYEYQLGEGDWIDIEGELSQSRGSYVDIELMLGTESGEVYIDFEEIKDEMEEQNLNSEDQDDVKTYFKNLIKK